MVGLFAEVYRTSLLSSIEAITTRCCDAENGGKAEGAREGPLSLSVGSEASARVTAKYDA